MPTHTVMTREDGDVKHSFDATDAEAVKVAMERFDELVGRQKMWAAEPGKDGAPGKLVKAFDPNADVVFMRQLIGG